MAAVTIPTKPFQQVGPGSRVPPTCAHKSSLHPEQGSDLYGGTNITTFEEKYEKSHKNPCSWIPLPRGRGLGDTGILGQRGTRQEEAGMNRALALPNHLDAGCMPESAMDLSHRPHTDPKPAWKELGRSSPSWWSPGLCGHEKGASLRTPPSLLPAEIPASGPRAGGRAVQRDTAL